MKFICAASALLAGLASAVPTPTENGPLDGRTVEKRATITDACPVGYCTLNGGTTGGAGGTTTTVSNLASFTAAVQAEGKAVILVSGSLTGAVKVNVTSNKSIIGKTGSSLTGIGLTILGQSNVIIRNLKSSKVLAEYGDVVTVQKSSNIWIDSCDFSSDLDHDKDYYDGLIDIVHASEWVTVSNSYLHDHWKGGLVGHSSDNGAEDTGHLHVTYYGNWWDNINSRTPMYRFGTGHVFNSYFTNEGDTVINTRDSAQMLIESSVWESCPKKGIFSNDSGAGPGYAVVRDIDLGGSQNLAAVGTLTSVPYSYTLLGSASTKTSVVAKAGQKLSF
ncbi:polysaccharide lyase family 1 protein [Xylariaceae sp. AK1471]|nr:polysaccharide lyase family 1 protein [Xylariaceae sp. AK1471]